MHLTPGQKTISAALEVGVLRQAVDAGHGLHVAVQDRGDIVGKAYNLG